MSTAPRRLPAGVGIGWRPQIAGMIARLPDLAFGEVVAESLCGHELPGPLAALRARGLPVVPHGVALSLGGVDPVDEHRVAHLADCAHRLGAPLVSEHIAFVRAGGLEAGHLVPLPRTREAVEAVVRNVRRTQDGLPVPLALEPIAALVEWDGAEYTEAQFVTEILERTDALLLLDVANVYANAVNAGRDPYADLDAYPHERIAYCHVAGGRVEAGLYHDSHTAPVAEPVLELVAHLASRVGDLAWLLERDGAYPPEPVLRAELDAIAAAARGRVVA
ncbi:MbnB/TglH/ChrH family RiPP precursor modification enzyme [Jatrophihabitans fulvus]